MSIGELQNDTSGEFKFLYNYFTVSDYTGAQILSSYALPITPLKFNPNLNNGIQSIISNKKIVWDFGDGTTSHTVSAEHVYTKPGRYRVSCYLYDRDGESYYDVYSVKVSIFDYIEDRLTIESTGNTAYNTGEIISPISVNRYNSHGTYNTSGAPTIVLHSSGADTDLDYFNTGLHNKTYGHLEPHSTFVQYLTTNGIRTAPG